MLWGYQVYGIDGSKQTVDNTTIWREAFEIIQQYRKVSGVHLLIYARFFLHAIPEEGEQLLFRLAKRSVFLTI